MIPIALVAERSRLDGIGVDNWYSPDLHTRSVEYCAAVFSRYWRGRRCLEMRPAEGVMTQCLQRTFPDLTLLEEAEPFCRALRDQFPRATVAHSRFEDFIPKVTFDTIVLGDVLEHVEAPAQVLAKASEWLAPGGIICCAARNAHSLHRQAAVLMGILEAESSVNPMHSSYTRQRVYDPKTFRAEFVSAGLHIHAFGGYWLQPLSNAHMARCCTPEAIDAFMRLGERYPDMAAEMYVISSKQ